MFQLSLSSQLLFSFSYWPANKKAKIAQEAGRGHSHDIWLKLAKGIFKTVQRYAQHINLEGRRRKEAMFGDTVFVFQSNRYASWSPAFLQMTEHLPSYGK